MILEEETYKRFGYHSKDLSYGSTKKIVVICNNCGKVREIEKRQYRTLCHSCSMKGKKNPNYGISLSGEKSPSWKGGPFRQECKVCGKRFSVKKNQVKRGNGKYCSISCSVKAQRHNARSHKTQPERIFEDLRIKYNLPFHFTGDGSHWLGNANPDFLHNTRKLCIEIYGDYWHSPLFNYNIRYTHTLEGRQKQLKAKGYKLIVLWESDLMRKDTEVFVLYTLAKYKIYPSTT